MFLTSPYIEQAITRFDIFSRFIAMGLAQPNPRNYSSGCPVQASLGRGRSVVTETFAIGN
jgi:hypothetical protein